MANATRMYDGPFTVVTARLYSTLAATTLTPRMAWPLQVAWMALVQRPLETALALVVQCAMLWQAAVAYALLRWRTEQPPEYVKAAHQKWLANESRYSATIRTVSVIVPVLNERGTIPRCLRGLTLAASEPERVEVVIVDAGCTDGTMDEVQQLIEELRAHTPGQPPVFRVTTSRSGRGATLNAGIRTATGDVVVICHADTVLPLGWDTQVVHTLMNPEVLLTAFSFGCDRDAVSNPEAVPNGLRLLEIAYNLRSRWFSMPVAQQSLAISAREGARPRTRLSLLDTPWRWLACEARPCADTSVR